MTVHRFLPSDTHLILPRGEDREALGPKGLLRGSQGLHPPDRSSWCPDRPLSSYVSAGLLVSWRTIPDPNGDSGFLGDVLPIRTRARGNAIYADWR